MKAQFLQSYHSIAKYYMETQREAGQIFFDYQRSFSFKNEVEFVHARRIS